MVVTIKMMMMTVALKKTTRVMKKMTAIQTEMTVVINSNDNDMKVWQGDEDGGQDYNG